MNCASIGATSATLAGNLMGIAPDGSVHHLECATFVYTRTPYDPGAPIPGGPPDPAH